jgi:hypothetical protein
VFGETLEFIMKLQERSFPKLKVPRILPFLSNAILELNGQSSEGIFRVPGDADYVTELVSKLCFFLKKKNISKLKILFLFRN